MAEAYIVEAQRHGGWAARRGPANWHPADLGAAILDALVGNGGSIPPAVDEDVIVGCVASVGEQSFQIGPQHGDGLVASRQRSLR